MKAHTSGFKSSLIKFGREINDKITYTINGVSTELGGEQLNSVTPHYEGALLKSVMKQLDIDSNVEIPTGTILRYQIGVKVNDAYEYIDFGNYVVKEIKKQEDTNSWLITCYDKMLYAMKDYDNTGITYPITIKNFLIAICNKINLTYAGGQFANSDKTIAEELYLDDEGRSMGYTFRDVLDEISQVSGGTICINDDDELEVRYIQDVGELVEKSGSSITITDGVDAKLNYLEIDGKTTQTGTPTPSSPKELTSVGFTNLLDLDNINIYPGYLNNNGAIYNSTTRGERTYDFLKAKPNTKYTFTIVETSDDTSAGYWFGIGAYSSDSESAFISMPYRATSNTSSVTFTTPNNTKYIRISGRYLAGASKVQLEQGESTHSYIPYGKYGINVIVTSGQNTDNYLYTLDNPIRSNENIKDVLYIKNNLLYVERHIGYKLLNGSETITAYSTSVSNHYRYGINITDILKSQDTTTIPNLLSSHYQPQILGTAGSWGAHQGISVDNTNSRIYINDDTYYSNDVTTYKNWLTNNNVEVQYLLAVPYVEELGPINIPNTYDGTTTINTTDALTPNLNIKYMSGIEQIDEEMLKDVNVNFGEKYGPINTIVLSRSSDSDKISLSIPSDIADDDKVAIQITDNQIMNGNNRAEFTQNLLSVLYGLEYYINDFSSTGIGYLDLCDRYNVKIDSNTYKCVMFNDELNRTQGLEEHIYTDMQEESEQEYKYMSATDEMVKKAYILVNKQKGEIEAKVSQDDIIASLNLAIEDEQGIVRLTGNQVIIDSDYFKLNADGSIQSTSGIIGGYKIGTNQLYAETYAPYDFNDSDITKVENYLAHTGTLTPEEIQKYDLNGSGTVTLTDLLLMQFYVQYHVTTTNSAKIIMQTGSNVKDNAYILQDGYGNNILTIGFSGITFEGIDVTRANTYTTLENKIGKWVDDKPIYRKVIETTTTSGTNTIPISDISSDLYSIVKIDGTTKQSSGNVTSINYYYSSSDYSNVYYDYMNSSIKIRCGSSYGFGQTTLIIEYTKIIN